MSKKPAAKPLAGKPEEKQPSLPPAIQEEIEREIGPLIPAGQRQQVVVRLSRVMMSEMFSGPIAHPRHLREYEEILPGSAERIVSMAEKAQSHNQSMETKIVNGSIRTSQHAMYLGFVALIILIGGAIYAGMNGNNILAGLLLAGAAFSGAATLIRGWANGYHEKRADRK